jgi:DNA-directed RNA polymerase specialized sigma24 family protein
MDHPDFSEILAALHRGDRGALGELLLPYEPYIRRVIRLRLTDPHLRRLLDTTDVCQSILAHFLSQFAAGKVEVRTPEQLRGLLVNMVLHKIIDRAREERRNAGSLPDGQDPAAPGPSPGTIAANRDLIQVIRARLTDKENRIFDRRLEGRSWQDVAEEMGDNPDALRMMYARALARIRADFPEQWIYHGE